jgi:hypothetical protein
VTRPRRTARRAALSKGLEIVVVVIFLLLMINVVLPWAAATLSDAFVRQLEGGGEAARLVVDRVQA